MFRTVTLDIRTVSKIDRPYVSIVNDGQYQCDSIGHGWKFSPILLERKRVRQARFDAYFQFFPPRPPFVNGVSG